MDKTFSCALLQNSIIKSSTSTLNPYAASYVPLFKREVTNGDKDIKNFSLEVVGSVAHPSLDDYKQKSRQCDIIDAVSYENSHETDTIFIDEESEMDLAYLQMVFPGVSDQSLADVYNVNRGDLDAALAMLSHLECADNLPDALDIEQLEEPFSSGQCSSAKAINMTGESSTSYRPFDSIIAT